MLWHTDLSSRETIAVCSGRVAVRRSTLMGLQLICVRRPVVIDEWTEIRLALDRSAAPSLGRLTFGLDLFHDLLDVDTGLFGIEDPSHFATFSF